MATNGEDSDARNGAQDAERRSPGNWLGRWVLMLAIVAFLVVYAVQLWQGAGLLYTIVVATGAMGIVGIVGMAVRQMLLRTASQDRATGILTQMERLRTGGNADDDANEGA